MILLVGQKSVFRVRICQNWLFLFIYIRFWDPCFRNRYFWLNWRMYNIDFVKFCLILADFCQLLVETDLGAGTLHPQAKIQVIFLPFMQSVLRTINGGIKHIPSQPLVRTTDGRHSRYSIGGILFSPFHCASPRAQVSSTDVFMLYSHLRSRINK